MLSEGGTQIICDGEGCEQRIKNHAWGKIKADGWFFSADGETSLCPEHVPDWYASWR